jgi:PHD/YefM family antitoxin component YafN of YafNO toxin-antitoxin module
MRQVNWRDFGERFDEFMELSKQKPIGILKRGKLLAVVISPEEYDHLQRLEDAYWIGRVRAAEARGEWVGPIEMKRELVTRATQLRTAIKRNLES